MTVERPNPAPEKLILEQSRKERVRLDKAVQKGHTEEGLIKAKDVAGGEESGVVVNTYKPLSGEVETTEFKTQKDFQKYIESQLGAEEASEYEQMVKDFDLVGKKIEARIAREMKRDPYFGLKLREFQEGRLPENQVDVFRGIMYSLTEGSPDVQDFGRKYGSITQKVSDIVKAAPSSTVTAVKDLFAEKDSLGKWTGALGVALPAFALIGLETKDASMINRFKPGSTAFNTLLWATYVGRFILTDFGGGKNGADIIGSGAKGAGRFMVGTFKTGEDFFTARSAILNPSNWKDTWGKISTGGSSKEKNLQFIESNRFLQVRKESYPGEIKALFEKQASGESLTSEDVTLASDIRRKAVYGGLANLGTSLLDKNFFEERQITDKDIIQAYSSAMVKDLDRLFKKNGPYQAAKSRQEAGRMTSEEKSSLEFIKPIDWTPFQVQGTPEQRAEIEKQFEKVLGGFKGNETKGYTSFSRLGAGELEAENFIDKPRKRTLLGLMIGGWLAATVLANGLSFARNIIGKLYGKYKDGQKETEDSKEEAKLKRQKRMNEVKLHLYPGVKIHKSLTRKPKGITFSREEPNEKGKMRTVYYPNKKVLKDGWGLNQSGEIIKFLQNSPSMKASDVKNIMKAFASWGLIEKAGDKEGFNALLKAGADQPVDDKLKEWEKKSKKKPQKIRYEMLGKNFKFDFAAGPNAIVEQMRKKFGAKALKEYFAVDTNKTKFKEAVLDKAKEWSLHPKVMKATYDSNRQGVWNKTVGGITWVGGYMPMIPGIYNKTILPGGSKMRDMHDNIGFDKRPWFDEAVNMDSFVAELLDPGKKENAPGVFRMTFDVLPGKSVKDKKIRFHISSTKTKEIKATGPKVIDFLSEKIKKGKHGIPSDISTLFNSLTDKTYKGKSISSEKEFVELITS